MQRFIEIFILFLILTICILGYQVYNISNAKNVVTTELENLKNQKPQTVTIKDTQVVYKYVDGQTIIKEKVPEGYVKFDVDKYNQALVKNQNLIKSADSLKTAQATLTKELQKLTVAGAVDTTTILHYKKVLTDTQASINSLLAQIKNPNVADYMIIQNKGFIFKPMVGAGYNGHFDGFAGAKLAFWGKYGLLVGSTREQAGIGVSRHIYDLVPYTKNTEIMVLGGFPYKKDYGRIFVGLGVGL